MAEATVNETEQTHETKGKKGSLGKFLFLGLNGLLFLAGAAFFVWTKFGILGSSPVSDVMFKDGVEVAQQAATKGESQPGAPVDAMGPPAEKSVLVGLSPFIVNLSGTNGRRYLSVTVKMEVSDEGQKAEVEKRLPQIRNRMIFLLSSKTLTDVSTPDGKYELQYDITQNLNEVLGKEIVKKILFINFVVQ